MRLLRVFGADGWDADAEGRIMTHQPIGRLAMREEGSYWLAYYALEGTMRDAVNLGMIALAFVKHHRRPRR